MSQKAPMLLTREKLGEVGSAAFGHPDSVTIQRVYRAQEKPDLVLGETQLAVAGAEHTVPKEIALQLVSTFKREQMANFLLCAFSPDHVFRFKKGQDQVEIVTCFTCSLMQVFVNSKPIGQTTLPNMQPVTDVPLLIPVEDDLRAQWGGDTYDRLVASTSATYQRIRVSEGVRKLVDAEVLAPPQPLNRDTFTKLKTLVVASPQLTAKGGNSFGMTGRLLACDLILTFDSDPPVQYHVKSNPFNYPSMDVPQLPSAVRDMMYADLKVLSEGS